MHFNRLTMFALKIFSVCAILLPHIIVAQSNMEKCDTPRNEEGRCILLPQCPSIVKILQSKPVSQENVEYLRKSGCGFQGLEPKVCCPIDTSGVSTTTSLPGGDFGNNGMENSGDLLPSLKHCGNSESNRIIGGDIAEIGEFPWMALLEYQTRSGKGFYCGGVLINSKYVLTAAHCIKGKDLPTTWRLVSVRLGEYNTSSSTDCTPISGGYECAPPPLDVPIESQIAHEDYDPYDVNQYHDIALLRLANTVPSSAYLMPICVPRGELLTKTFEGNVMYVAGWGKTENRSASDVIMKLRIQVNENTQCAPTYKTVRVAIDDNQLCAGGLRGQDSCRGDSGGPLMQSLNVGDDTNFYVLGIVSFGPSPCGMEKWPGVYTRVTKYVPWIISKLKP